MKTVSSAAKTLATPLLRIAYQQSFNEEQIRIPLVKVQSINQGYGWEYRTHPSAASSNNWDEAWYASYE
jgi:hypothetical protein